VKYLAYAAWSDDGLRSLRNYRSIGSALGFGFVRLGLGILFGFGIFLVGSALHLNVPALLYLSIYAPVRCVEWSMLAALLGSQGGELFRTGDGASERWIVGGIVVSHLADVPMMLFSHGGTIGFLHVGRFLCRRNHSVTMVGRADRGWRSHDEQPRLG
jgi:hypothetical protein